MHSHGASGGKFGANPGPDPGPVPALSGWPGILRVVTLVTRADSESTQPQCALALALAVEHLSLRVAESATRTP